MRLQLSKPGSQDVYGEQIETIVTVFLELTVYGLVGWAATPPTIRHARLHSLTLDWLSSAGHSRITSPSTI